MTSVEEARTYVGTTPTSGASQFSLLLIEGLEPYHHVVEVGCGALHLARPLVTYLEPKRYTGVDPNVWLRNAARAHDPALDSLLESRGAQFSDAVNFRAGRKGKADYVYSHSVLSHASRDQLTEYMTSLAWMLRPGGVGIASIRLSTFDSNDTDWVYPGVSYFTYGTVLEEAANAGLEMSVTEGLRAVHMANCPNEFHDWLLFHRRG